jgi:hypothetical protein
VPCSHFAFHTGCNITVCNLLISVPTGTRNPSRRRDIRYKLPRLGRQEGGWRTGYVAFVVILAGPPTLWEPKNCFTRALPTVSVPGYLVTVSVSVYIKIYAHRFASSPYLQLLTHKPYNKETYQYSCAFL